MNFSQMIKDLKSFDKGWTLETIGSELGISAMSVHRIENGVTKDPGWSKGDKLIQLWKNEKRKADKRAKSNDQVLGSESRPMS